MWDVGVWHVVWHAWYLVWHVWQLVWHHSGALTATICIRGSQRLLQLSRLGFEWHFIWYRYWITLLVVSKVRDLCPAPRLTACLTSCLTVSYIHIVFIQAVALCYDAGASSTQLYRYFCTGFYVYKLCKVVWRRDRTQLTSNGVNRSVQVGDTMSSILCLTVPLRLQINK